jgi:hypothetical protein
MMTFLLTILAAILVVIAGAFALPISKRIVIGWVRLYTAFVPELGEARRAEVLSDIHEQISASLAEGYRPVEIAPQILYRLVIGLPDDVAWCAPFVPSMLASKVARLSESLRSFRTPKILVPSLATVGYMNWAYLSSSSERTLVMWLGLNGATAAMIVLLSKQQHAWARRVLYALTGAAGITMLGFMAWQAGPSKLYEMIQLPMFRGFLLAMSAIGLMMLVAEKSIRTRLFMGRWRYVVICWLLIIGLSLVASTVLAGGVAPVLEAWVVAALFVAAIFAFFGIIALMAAAFWYGCLRGSAAGLRVVAAGLRRLK